MSLDGTSVSAACPAVTFVTLLLHPARRNLGALTHKLGSPQLTLSPTMLPHVSAFAGSRGVYEYGSGGCAANHVRFVGSPPDTDGDGEVDDPSSRYFDECEASVDVADRLVPGNLTQIVGPGDVGFVMTVSSWAPNKIESPSGPLALMTRACVVVEPYVSLDCTLPPGVGRRLEFRIEALAQVRESSLRERNRSDTVRCVCPRCCRCRKRSRPVSSSGLPD